MSKISTTLLFCMGTQIAFLYTTIKGYRAKDWENSIQKFVDYLGVFIGIPFFIFTIYAFFTSL